MGAGAVEQSQAELGGDGPRGGEPTTSSASMDALAEEHVPQLSAEARAQLIEIRSRLEARVGQLVLLMMTVPRYCHHSLADLHGLVIEPLLRDRIAVAQAKPDGDTGAATPSAPVGIAIWASVDDAVEQKINEQVKDGAVPVRLAADDWTSGEKLWLLDIIAPNRQLATAVLLHFRTIAGERPVSLHPMVARSIDPDALAKLKLL